MSGSLLQLAVQDLKGRPLLAWLGTLAATAMEEEKGIVTDGLYLNSSDGFEDGQAV